MRKIKALIIMFAVAALGACAGGEGGKDLTALDAQYIARTSSLVKLAAGLQGGNGRSAHDAALNEFFATRNIDRGEVTLTSEKEDYVKEANRPENYTDERTVWGDNSDAYDAAWKVYEAARAANMFGKNTGLAWGGTFSGPVVAEQWSGPIVRDWIDNGTITLILSKNGNNLSGSFTTEMSDPSNNRGGAISSAIAREFWYTEKNGNDVTAIAGQFQLTNLTPGKTNNFYFSAGK